MRARQCGRFLDSLGHFDDPKVNNFNDRFFKAGWEIQEQMLHVVFLHILMFFCSRNSPNIVFKRSGDHQRETERPQLSNNGVWCLGLVIFYSNKIMKNQQSSYNWTNWDESYMSIMSSRTIISRICKQRQKILMSLNIYSAFPSAEPDCIIS